MKKTLAIVLAILIFCLGVGAASVAQKVQAEICPHFTVIVDGEKQTFTDANGTQVYPLVYNGTTYLPVRAISNLMGKNVYWDAATSTITLKSPSQDLGGSLLYEDKNVAIRFDKITRGKYSKYSEEEYSFVYFNITNKTDDECKLYLDSFAVNGTSYNDFRYAPSIASQSPGNVRFYTETEITAAEIKKVSGKMHIYPSTSSYTSYDITFSNIEIQ